MVNANTMNKQSFLSILKHVLRYRAKPQSVPCRCVGCCNERQKRQGKTATAVSK